jgi:hypothetical protein
MCKEIVNLTIRAKTYDIIPTNHANGGATDIPSTTTSPPSSAPLQIERPIVESMLCPPKSAIQKSVFNQSSRVAQSYNIV